MAKIPPIRPLTVSLSEEEAASNLKEDKSPAFDKVAITNTNSMTELPIMREYGT
jgi:hypothetical protein